MAETNPETAHLEDDTYPRLIYFDDATETAKETLDKFKVDVESDPLGHADAVSFYAAHPEAAIALVALAKQRPNILHALENVQTIFTNNYDLQTGFDEETELRLEADPTHRRFIEKMQKGRGKEVQADAKQRMRFNRLKFFIQGHDSPGTGPDTTTAA